MQDTRTEILKLATELVKDRGFNGFSYADISKALEMKNAAVHYHFPTKEDLIVAIVKRKQESLKQLKKSLIENGLSELEQLKVIVGRYLDLYNQNKMCSIGSLSSDVLSLPDKVHVELRLELNAMIDWVEEILEIGRKKKVFHFSGESKIRAMMVLNNLIAGSILGRLDSDNKGLYAKVLDQLLEDLTN